MIMCYMNLKCDSEKLRKQFKQKCNAKGLTITNTINILMKKVVNGKIKIKTNIVEA